MKIVFEHKEIMPVTRYGGTERVLFWHMCELTRRGHDVTLIGNKKSLVEKHGIKLIKRDDQSWQSQIPKDTDVIHLQYNFEGELSAPIISTVHGNGKVGETFSKNCAFVSKNHAKRHGSDQYVHNAIDLREFPYTPREFTGLNRFMFLAKASWSVKNLKDCVRACKESKKILNVAGGRSLFPSRYIKNHGLVDQKQKMEIFKNSDALLFPVRWNEPFGIAIIEAMSQGLPVIGSPYGSLPELITEETGIICNNYDEFLSAINGNKKFNPQKIREYVEKNFSIENYTDKYLNLYERVISGENLNKSPLKTLGDKDPEELLHF